MSFVSEKCDWTKGVCLCFALAESGEGGQR